MGIQVPHMDLIVGEHGVEEGRERRNQASPQGVDEEWNLGGCPLDGGARCGPDHRPPPFVEVTGERWVDLVHGFLVEHQRPTNSGFNDRRWLG